MQRNILLFAYLFLEAAVAAQQYPFVHYTPKDGLVNNRARFIFQDSKGKLYISTFGGLSIYDGSRFTNYTTDNGLVVNLVNDIVEMGDDSLWIIPNVNRVHCLVNGKLKDLKTRDNFYPIINQLIKCSDGFYYALADEGLFRFEKDRFIRISLTGLPDPEAGRYLGMAVEMDGKLFMLYDKTFATSSSGALLVYDLVTKKIIAYQNKTYCNYITRTPDSELWVSTSNGVLQVNKKSIAEGSILFSALPPLYKITKGIIPNIIYADRQKNIWLATNTGLLKINTEGKNFFYTEKNGLPNNIQTSIFQDRENNMWFTNEQNGFTKLPGKDLAFFPEPIPGFTTTDIFINPATDSVWFYDGYHNRSLLLAENKPMQEYFISGPALSLSKITAGQKNYIISGPDIYSWEPVPGKSRYNLQLLYHDSSNSTGYTSATMDKSGNLIASSDKITVLTGNKVLITPLHYFADQVDVDRENRIWVAARSKKIFCFGVNITQTDTSLQLLRSYSDELPQISPRSITTDNDGNVWVGTRDHGLFCFFFDGLSLKSWKQITTRNGLSENFVTYLYCDPDNTIWACTPAGLDKVRLKDAKFSIENITSSNNIYQSIIKIQATRPGVHWVLTPKGVIKIGPQQFFTKTIQPELLFTEITSGNERLSLSKNKLSLTWRQNNLSFHIAAPSFADEKQTRFSYLLEGSGNSAWSEPSTNTEINFANLPSGKYTLKAKAIFLNGLYADTESAFSFVITPPWWQTWWFRAAIGVFGIGILVLVIRFYYRRKLEKQKTILEKQQAIEKERTRIATDMHDDLGAGLSRIKFLSQSISNKKTENDIIKTELEKITKYSDEMSEKMGEIVWALNEKNDTIADLVAYTRSYTVEYLANHNIHCEADTPSHLPGTFITGDTRRHIFLSVKECLHNIVKHAAATQVYFSVALHGSIQIILHDNGKGIDWNNQRANSNGLQNIQQRMKEIKGKAEFLNEQGTKVILHIPLNV